MASRKAKTSKREAQKGSAAVRASRAPGGTAALSGTSGVRPTHADLGEIRERIDSIDARIHALLNERAGFAQQVGISKTKSGRAVDFYRPEREADVLRKALKRNKGPLRDEEIARLFREIMSACLAQQEPLKVAFLGPEGTFTQAAVLKHFGSSVRALPPPAIHQAFHAVAKCRGWWDERWPEVERVPVSSNAEGARRARDERGTAAIASSAAAEIYGLSLLVNDIEDRADNTTRFLIVGRKLFSASGADRTTLLVSASDTDDPGALFRLLEPLAEHRINMTRIESRPSRKRKWDYVFFIDVEGHVSDPPLAKALPSLEKRASLFKILGSYPRAVL